MQPSLRSDTIEPRAEPEGDTRLARLLIQVVGTGNPSPGDVLSAASGTSLVRVTTPMEGQIQVTPKVRFVKIKHKFCLLKVCIVAGKPVVLRTVS